MRLYSFQSILILIAFLLPACETIKQNDPILSAADKAFSNQEYEAAINLYQQVALKRPKSQVISLKLGESYLALGNLEEAKPYFDKAAAGTQNRYSLSAKKQLGRIALKQGDCKKSLTIFEDILKEIPEDGEAINGLGVSFDQLGQHKNAQTCYLKNIGADPKDINAKSNLGLSKLFDKSYDEGLAILEPIGTNPDATVQQRHNLALAYAFSNFPEKCREILKKEIDPEQIEKFIRQLNTVSLAESDNVEL